MALGVGRVLFAPSPPIGVVPVAPGEEVKLRIVGKLAELLPVLLHGPIVSLPPFAGQVSVVGTGVLLTFPNPNRDSSDMSRSRRRYGNFIRVGVRVDAITSFSRHGGLR
jgi:hypothetical protein